MRGRPPRVRFPGNVGEVETRLEFGIASISLVVYVSRSMAFSIVTSRQIRRLACSPQVARQAGFDWHMTLKSAIAIIRQDIEYFGIACAIYDVVVRLLGRFMFVKILRVLALSSITTEHILPSNYRFERIPGEQLPALSKNKECGVNPVLLQELARGENVCFGIY